MERTKERSFWRIRALPAKARHVSCRGSTTRKKYEKYEEATSSGAGSAVITLGWKEYVTGDVRKLYYLKYT
jgi:hypothetical protein